MFWEMLIGGGGHVFEVQGIALRPFLFLFAIFNTIYILAINKYRLRYSVFVTFLTYLCLIFYGVLIGVTKGFPLNSIISDVKPFFYLLLLSILIHFRRFYDYKYINMLVIVSSLVISLYVFTILISLTLGLLSFESLYAWGMSSGEFLFRGKEGLFFYKAVYVVCAGFLILLLKKDRTKKEFIFLGIFLISILITMTKGLILCIGLIIITFFLYRQRFLMGVLSLGIGIVLFMFLVFTRNELDSSNISLSTRALDIEYVVQNTSFTSLFFGNGFGSEIRGRTAIENSYIWIWWKLGIFPIIFIVGILVNAFHYYRRLRGNREFLADAYLGLVLFVYLISLINPLITNVIGMTIIFLSFAGFKSLGVVDQMRSKD